MGPDSVKEVKVNEGKLAEVNEAEAEHAVAPADEQSEIGIAGAVSRETTAGSVAEVSKYDCLRSFNFRAGPNKMPSADELISLEILPGTIRVVVNSPRVRDQGADNEPTYIEVLQQSLERIGVESDVVIDLSKVKYLASPIVGALGDLRDKLQQNGHRLILEGEGPDVVAMLKVTGFLSRSGQGLGIESSADLNVINVRFPASEEAERNGKKGAKKVA